MMSLALTREERRGQRVPWETQTPPSLQENPGLDSWDGIVQTSTYKTGNEPNARQICESIGFTDKIDGLRSWSFFSLS